MDWPLGHGNLLWERAMKAARLKLMEDGVSYTIKEYVDLEEYSNIKHEYIEGQIRAMSGGTIEHSRLASAIIGELGRQLSGRPCAVYTSDARVRVEGKAVITYPDISVGCGRLALDTEDRCAQLNPTVLIEVTSPSTERYDRGKKFAYYRQISALREYVIVAQDERLIEVFRRCDDDTWMQADRYFSGDRATLSSIGCELDVDAIYRDPRAASS